MNREHSIKRTLVISDNPRIAAFLRTRILSLGAEHAVKLMRSRHSHAELVADSYYESISARDDAHWIVENFDLVVSAHCKQIFPASLHENVECLNIHPGYNPLTRGWYPQVWSILKGLPLGFTVHRIDAKLDHGSILYREELPLYAWDTSGTAYQRVLDAELSWLDRNLPDLLQGGLEPHPMDHEGNLFLRRDFEQLCELDLNTHGRFNDFLALLRASSFPGHRNAWFLDPVSGRKVYVRVELEPEQ